MKWHVGKITTTPVVSTEDWQDYDDHALYNLQVLCDLIPVLSARQSEAAGDAARQTGDWVTSSPVTRGQPTSHQRDWAAASDVVWGELLSPPVPFS